MAWTATGLERFRSYREYREMADNLTATHAALTLGMSVPPPSQLQWTMEELPIDGVPVPVKSTLPPAKTG